VVESEESLRLENSICKGLLRLSLEHDVSPFTLTLATFAIILRKYTREVLDLCFSFKEEPEGRRRRGRRGRKEKKLWKDNGWFMHAQEEIVLGSSSASCNPLVLRVSVGDTDSFATLVGRVKAISSFCAH